MAANEPEEFSAVLPLVSVFEEHEALMWSRSLRTHTNPILREVGMFLTASLAIDEQSMVGSPTSFECADVAIADAIEAISWAHYFSQHSLDVLFEAACFIAQLLPPIADISPQLMQLDRTLDA